MSHSLASFLSIIMNQIMKVCGSIISAGPVGAGEATKISVSQQDDCTRSGATGHERLRHGPGHNILSIDEHQTSAHKPGLLGRRGKPWTPKHTGLWPHAAYSPLDVCTVDVISAFLLSLGSLEQFIYLGFLLLMLLQELPC